MKVKSGIIYNGIETIIELADKKMPIKLAGKFFRLIEDLNKENKIIERQRQIIIEKYGNKDETGQLIINEGTVSFSNENAELVQQELNELSEIEVEINDREITEEELENANLELTIAQYSILKEFIKK